MMENFEITEYERIVKVQSVLWQYGIENFCMSYSGGKDSNVLSKLLDIAVPDNRIPRVYCDTGIEYEAIRKFVKEKAQTDSRIHIITPQKNIKTVLETQGYPFKSKEHSAKLEEYQKKGICAGNAIYFYKKKPKNEVQKKFLCPKRLLYQLEPDFKLKISDRCCENLKEKPLRLWQRKMGYKISIIGIRQAENGRRKNAKCLAFEQGKLRAFQPLAPVSNEWEEYMIQKYNIDLPVLYKPPYNFTRTGCKGCPFALKLQFELDQLEKYFPNERKQCEWIWKPVYDEYRRINYRLKPK